MCVCHYDSSLKRAMKPRILIVDDDVEICTQMKWALSSDYDVLIAKDRVSATEQFKVGKPSVTLLDLGLPPAPNDTSEGMTTLAHILHMDRHAKVIIVSGQGERANATRAVGAGAYDFLCKPVDMVQMSLLLQRCVYVSELESEYREMQQEEHEDMFEGILGASKSMHDVFQTIRKVAASDVPVLVLGESGTGKEMVANAIHRQSSRREKPFMAINCSAIPENLLESELFGYEKGAFTGAVTQKSGLIEHAAGGTLFLDEIGDLPPQLQVKLLRFLQERKIQRVGGRKEMEVDTRVVAATNRNLEQATREGSFREDLFFRLAVVVCRLPALRDRGADVMLLARDFLRRFGNLHHRADLHFDLHATQAIARYPWPGNVRELQNRVQRAVIMAEGKRLSVEDLELSGYSDAPVAVNLKDARESLERDMILQALEKHDQKISAAAKDLGISRPTFYDLMNKLGISVKEQDHA